MGKKKMFTKGAPTDSGIDTVNLVACFSLRLAVSGYAGNCIKVRRDSDDATQDIGFSGGIIDTASMETFVGGGNNGYVDTWYDQSGSGRDHTQATTTAQPQIVSSGTTLTDNSHPAILNASGDKLENTTVNQWQGTGGFSVFCVGSINTTTFGKPIWDFDDTSGGGVRVGSFRVMHATAYANLLVNVTSDDRASAISINTQYLFTGLHITGSTTGEAFVNGATDGTTSITSGGAKSSKSKIGSNTAGWYWRGYITEILHYDGDKSSEQSTIEGEINTFYTIY